MIATIAVGDMFVDINQPGNEYFDADFFLHFTVQGGKDPFAMFNLAAGHDPQTVEGLDAATGEENTFVLIDDTGNDCGLDPFRHELNCTGAQHATPRSPF